MATECRKSPYLCHVFVCVNERPEGQKSCGGSGNAEVRSLLKAGVRQKGWEGKVRVSGSLCMGLCAEGPNVILYPQGIWYSGVSTSEVETVLARIAEFLG